MIGANTSLLSPKLPWQDAHWASQISSPRLTLPWPAGRPLKSGRTSMSQALTSAGVALRPMPSKRACENAKAGASINAASSANPGNRSRKLDIPDLPAWLNEPGLDRVVVIDAARATNLTQLGIGRLDMPRLVHRAAHQQRRFAVP